MVFMGHGFTSGGQESGSVFSAAVCKIQVSKCYIESLPLVPKDNRSCFSQSERSAVQQPLDCVRPPEVGRLTFENHLYSTNTQVCLEVSHTLKISDLSYCSWSQLSTDDPLAELQGTFFSRLVEEAYNRSIY